MAVPMEDHWIIPIYKRNSPSLATNYRGVHLTAILSKIAEKMIGGPVMKFLDDSGIWGDSQFAFRKKEEPKMFLHLSLPYGLSHSKSE